MTVKIHVPLIVNILEAKTQLSKFVERAEGKAGSALDTH
jgi:hypothetical protein